MDATHQKKNSALQCTPRISKGGFLFIAYASTIPELYQTHLNLMDMQMTTH